MKEAMQNGWTPCDHITLFMRKSYGFRMIGKRLYCRPLSTGVLKERRLL